MTETFRPTIPRSQRDLVTNPAFDDLLAELVTIVETEIQRLTTDAQQPELGRIHFQAGVVEGAKRALNRIKNFRSAILEDYGKGGDEPT